MVVATACTQHPRQSHALSVTLLLFVKGMRAFPRVVPGGSHQRRPGRHTTLEPPLRSDTCTSAACSGSFRSASPAPSHANKQTLAKPIGAARTTALYGSVCLSLCNGPSRATTHVLQTALGCWDHVFNNTSSCRLGRACWSLKPTDCLLGIMCNP